MNTQNRSSLSRRDKTRDLLIGLGVFFGGNILLTILILVVAQLSNTALPKNFDAGGVFAIILFCLPPLANIAAWIFFIIKRRWAAIGMTAGLIASIACALIGFALLMASGFSLV